VKYFWKYGIPAYVNALSGKIYFNGSYSSVKIYDGMVPPNATGDQIYIVLGERLSNQTSNKTMKEIVELMKKNKLLDHVLEILETLNHSQLEPIEF